MEYFMDTRFLSISEGSFRCIKFFESMSPASNISEELARFKVWVGNIGACEEGFDSLDDRLFDAPHLWYQILDLLEDLWRCLLDVECISRGELVPWDQFSQDSEQDGDTDTNEWEENETPFNTITWEENEIPFDPNEWEESEIPFHSELDQIRADITEILDSLYQLAVSAENPALRDYYEKEAWFSDDSTSEKSNIEHHWRPLKCALCLNASFEHPISLGLHWAEEHLTLFDSSGSDPQTKQLSPILACHGCGKRMKNWELHRHDCKPPLRTKQLKHDYMVGPYSGLGFLATFGPYL